MAGKKTNVEDEATSQPQQQVQEDTSQTGATNFGNIDSEGEQFGNIEPD
jgi:hypothetical protein